MTPIEYFYKVFVWPRIFNRTMHDPELGHEWGVKWMKRMARFGYYPAKALLSYNHPILRTKVMGLQFENPLGLAAGFDKQVELYAREIPMHGWGFCEVGGITQHGQGGNDRPRMWRSLRTQSLCNAMGFNNPGADVARRKMERSKLSPIPVGLNVGKSKNTPLETAVFDYKYTVRQLVPFAQFITINPSSPNTPGLRELQKKEALEVLVSGVKSTLHDVGLEFWNRGEKKMSDQIYARPIGIKISPDESPEQIADILDVCFRTGVNFLILGNSTTSRVGCERTDFPPVRGGASGKVLTVRAEELLKEVYGAIKDQKHRPALIGVGGIYNAESLYKRITYGADLCQVYTAWQFEGPDFVKRTLKGLVQILKSEGFNHVSEAVGCKAN